MSLITIKSKEEYLENTKGEGVMVIDFWASWCGPCKVMAPIYEKVAQDNSNQQLKFAKVEADELPQMTNEFGVQGLPTFVVFKYKDGEIVGNKEYIVGSSDPIVFAEKIHKLVEKVNSAS